MLNVNLHIDAVYTYVLSLLFQFNRLNRQSNFYQTMARRNDFLDAKVYVGGLPEDADSEELKRDVSPSIQPPVTN